MVKASGGGEDTTQVSAEGVDASDAPPVTPINKEPKLNKRKIYIVAALVVVVITGGVAWYLLSRPPHVNPTILLPTEEQAIQQEVKKLSENPPAASTSETEKVGYYDDLAFAKADAGDYVGAVEAFKQRVAISTEGLDWLDYYHYAQYLDKAGDKSGAIKALDTSANLLPPDDPTNGFSKAEKQDIIKQYKQDLAS